MSNLLLVPLFFILFFAFQSGADWKPENLASYQIVYSRDLITVDKEGLATSVSDFELKALNDEGRNHLVMQTIPFSPDSSKIEVLKASSVTDGVERRVDLKKIMTRAAGGDRSGVSGLKEVVIPFTNIKVGSTIKYTVKKKTTRSLVKGFFHGAFNFGVNAPELGGEARIRSLLPLHVVVNDPWKVLVSKQYKDGEYFVFEVKQKKPLFKFPQELNPILRKDTISMVEVSTMDSWKKYSKSISENYEKILADKKLPISLQSIADKASKQKVLEDIIDTVTSELATVMTYSGDWTSFDKMFFPKSLAEIGKMKVGDCKDFSIATVAVLRKLGIDAKVAITYRKSYGKMGVVLVDPIDIAIPNQNFFNHAIVKVKSANRVIWVDPTNIVSNSRYVFSDIAGSFALEVSQNATGLEKIPFPEKDQSYLRFSKKVKISEDNTAESKTKFELRGEYAKYVLEGAIRQNEEVGKKVLMSYLRTDFKTAKSFYENINLKSRIAQEIKGTQAAHGEQLVWDKEGKKYFFAALPLSLQGYLQIEEKRVTDINMLSTFKEKSFIRVKGYDFVGQPEGCTILTPWFRVVRNFIKLNEGFEIQDSIKSNVVEIPASEVNSDKFGMAVGDIGDCARTQSVEIRKIGPKESFEQRLKAYTIAAAKAQFDISGPKSIEGSRKALHIVENILAQDSKNKEALLLKARALRRVGYKSEAIDRTEYLDEAEYILDELIKEFPQDPAVLSQKAYSAYYKKNFENMAVVFQKLYSFAPKDHELFYLGGLIAENTQKYPVALGSYVKSLSLAKNRHERHLAAKAIGEVYYKMDNLNKTIVYLKQSIVEEPENSWTQGRLLQILAYHQRWDEAIEIGEGIMKTNPYGYAQKDLANAYAGKGSRFLSMAKIKRSDIDSLESKKLTSDAEALFLKGLKYDQSNFKCLSQLGFYYSEWAQRKQDTEMARKAISYMERAQKSPDAKSGEYSSLIAVLQKMASGGARTPANARGSGP